VVTGSAVAMASAPARKRSGGCFSFAIVISALASFAGSSLSAAVAVLH
jgi:hypothetical protein